MDSLWVTSEVFRIVTVAALPALGLSLVAALVAGVLQNATNIFDPIFGYTGRVCAFVVWALLVGHALWGLLKDFMERSLAQ